MFGARNELTRLAIKTNAIGTRDERVLQQTAQAFAG